MNQSSANVSVVRLGQADTDTENGDITLTVDPPTFAHSTAGSVSTNVSTDPGGLVDPFMEMDPEQLERLETALQSEEAKQILGENVTAMLGTLYIYVLIFFSLKFFFISVSYIIIAMVKKFLSILSTFANFIISINTKLEILHNLFLFLILYYLIYATSVCINSF